MKTFSFRSSMSFNSAFFLLSILLIFLLSSHKLNSSKIDNQEIIAQNKVGSLGKIVSKNLNIKLNPLKNKVISKNINGRDKQTTSLKADDLNIEAKESQIDNEEQIEEIVTEEDIYNANSNDLFGSTISLFISGFGDKSFFVSTIASVNYNKWIAGLASFVGLILMGVMAMFLGIEISHFVPFWIIDVVSSVLFIVMGLKMIFDAINTPEDEHFINLNQESHSKNEKNLSIKKDYNNHCQNYIDNIDDNRNLEIGKIDYLNTSEALVFEIAGTSDDEELQNRSNIKLQTEFEKQYKDNENTYLKSEDTKTSVKNSILENLKKTKYDSFPKEENENQAKIPNLWYQFVQVATLVCIGEIGDRSQVSIIYISSQAGLNVVLGSIILSNILLCVVSVLCGKLLATRFSIKNLTLISGWLFVLLGFVALMYTAINDFGFNKVKVFSNSS